jgi:hypothetical protein
MTYTTTETPRASTRMLWLCDRIDLLREIESIGVTLALLETRVGLTDELGDLQRRLQTVRVHVMAQLRDALPAAIACATVH